MKRFAIALAALVTTSLFASGAFAAEKTLTVAADGSGEFKTVLEAIAAVPEKSDDRTIIHIKPGTYDGPFVVTKGKNKVSFVGDDKDKTTLAWAFNVKGPIPAGSDKFNPGLQVLADDFRAENITIANTSGEWGQGLAAKLDGDRAVVKNCRLTGWQDTLMVNNGRQYFRDCYIEGRVDFIYGSATAVFDHCSIHSKNGGFVTAASTPQDQRFGFVFLDCKLTGDDTPWNPATTNPATTQPMSKPNKPAYFGRPWRPYAAVSFIRCEVGDHLKKEGWHNWGKVTNESTARYSEYKNTGPGAETSGRAKWAKQLTDDEAAKYTVENILGGKDGWNPTS